MSAAKSYFTPVFVLLLMLVLIIVVGYFSWQVAAAWFNSPTPGITAAAPLPSVTAAPIPPQQATAAHETTPEDFLGIWTGKWDNTYAARLTITRANGQSFRVMYAILASFAGTVARPLESMSAACWTKRSA